MRDRYIKFIERLNKYIKLTMALALAVMSIVIGMQVFCRIIQSALPWSEELTRYLMVYVVFVGGSVAYYEGAHMVVEVFEQMLPEKAKKVQFLCIHVTICFFFIILSSYGMDIVIKTKTQLAPALQFPMRYVLFIIPLSCALITLNGIALILQRFSREGAPQ